MTLAICFQNLSRLLLLDTNFSNFLLRPVLEMKISWESSTGFPLTQPYCCSRSSLSISMASTGFLSRCTRKMEKMSSVLTFILDELGKATVGNSVWLPYRFFQHVATALPRQEAFEIEVGNQLFLRYDIEKESCLVLVNLGNGHRFYKLHNYEVFWKRLLYAFILRNNSFFLLFFTSIVPFIWSKWSLSDRKGQSF